MADASRGLLTVATLLGGVLADPKLLGFRFGDDLNKLSLTTSDNEIGFAFDEVIQKGDSIVRVLSR